MNILIREIKALPTLMRWRKDVLECIFGEMPPKRLLVANRQYYRRHMADGTHIAVLADVDGMDAGCGAICLSEELPSPDNPSGRCACLMNIYVKEELRGNGIGHAIVSWLVAKSRLLGCGRIYLETTPGTRSLYRDIGFDDLS